MAQAADPYFERDADFLAHSLAPHFYMDALVPWREDNEAVDRSA